MLRDTANESRYDGVMMVKYPATC